MNTLDRLKLAAVLGMMGSTHEGEILAAARQAERMRRDAGLTWQQIVVPAQPAPHPVQSIGDAIGLILAHSEVLTNWEADFALSVAAQKYPISEKQLAVIKRLLMKAQRAEARAA